MLTGWLVYKFPMLISGLNTMPKKRLERINVEGLKRDYRNVLLIAGGAMLLLAGISTLVHVPIGVHLVVLMAAVLGIVVAGFVLARKYDAGLQGEEGKKERKKSMIGLIIAVVVTIGILFFFFKGNKPATIEVSDDYITAKGGGYSASIAMRDIAEANMLARWPDISLRTNGLSTDEVSIGHFRLKGGESCMLFLCDDGGPVLEVRTADGGLYYLNCDTKEETLEMFSKLKETIDVKTITGNYGNRPMYRHGGQGSAISQARRRIPNAWEIAGQARNDDFGVGFVPCPEVASPVSKKEAE